PPHAFFAEVSPSLFAHTFCLGEVIVETLRACHARRVTIDRFMRENELVLKAGDAQVQPDCFFRLAAEGRAFNLAFEVDNSTASSFGATFTHPEPLLAPLLLDPFGTWQSLIDLHPTAPYRKAPVRFPRRVESPLVVC